MPTLGDVRWEHIDPADVLRTPGFLQVLEGILGENLKYIRVQGPIYLVYRKKFEYDWPPGHFANVVDGRLFAHFDFDASPGATITMIGKINQQVVCEAKISESTTIRPVAQDMDGDWNASIDASHFGLARYAIFPEDVKLPDVFPCEIEWTVIAEKNGQTSQPLTFKTTVTQR